MARHAILFGLNYEKTLPEEKPSRTECAGLQPLRGSINSVQKMRKMLASDQFNFDDIRTFTDDKEGSSVAAHGTTAYGIWYEMRALALRSHIEELEVAWIHFSGRAVQVLDDNSDERDGYDQCIVPSDFKQHGLIPDDKIREILATFHPDTRVVCVFDCDNSGTIGDLKYRYLEAGGGFQTQHRRSQAFSACKANILLFGASGDSASAPEIQDDTGSYSGSLTNAVVDSIQRMGGDPKTVNTPLLLDDIRAHVYEKYFNPQMAQLTCSYLLREGDTLF